MITQIYLEKEHKRLVICVDNDDTSSIKHGICELRKKRDWQLIDVKFVEPLLAKNEKAFNESCPSGEDIAKRLAKS